MTAAFGDVLKPRFAAKAETKQVEVYTLATNF